MCHYIYDDVTDFEVCGFSKNIITEESCEKIFSSNKIRDTLRAISAIVF